MQASLCYRPMMQKEPIALFASTAYVPRFEENLVGQLCVVPLGLSKAFVLLSGAGGLLRLRPAR